MLFSLFASAKERSQMRLLSDKHFFRAGFYCKKLSLAQRFRMGNPVLHYLRKGWQQGRDPHPGFSTSWYIAQYPDVVQGGMNPFVHFLRFGMFEERKPSEHGAISDIAELKGSAIWCYQQAWSGYVASGIEGLKQLADRADRDALWCLAKWYFRYSDFAESMARLEQLSSLDGGRFSRRLACAIAKCALNQRQEHKARAFIANATTNAPQINYPLISPEGLNAALILLSQVALSFEERVAPLNRLLSDAGLAVLEDAQERTGSGLKRLTTSASHRVTDSELKITVVMAVFNGEDTVATALRSLLRQSWQNIEIIVVNDASTDATQACVERLASSDSRLRLINNRLNKGAYASRNVGMQVASGDYITVHDSDDWSHPHKLELQARALQNNPGKMASQSYWVRVDEQLRAIGPGHMDLDFIEPNASSYMFRSEVLETLGFWHEVKVSADTEYVDRLRAHYGSDATIDVLGDLPLSFSLVRQDSLTRDSATHSRTFHYGLRNLYHQAAHWWHRTSAGLACSVGGAAPFPVALGNQLAPRQSYDIAIVANASVRNPDLAQLLSHLETLAERGKSLVLFSWSLAEDFASKYIADAVWDICQVHNIGVAHAGISLRCREIHVEYSDAKNATWPDKAPQLSGVQIIQCLDSQALSSKTEQHLRRYFEAGGIIAPATGSLA